MFQSKYLKILFIALLVFLPFCDDEEQSSNTADTWLIPESEIHDGGPGKDGIPAIDNPKFIPISQVSFLLDGDLVIGVQIGEVITAYPHPILDQHEITNHTVGNTSFALTYCPLTGTGIAWDTSQFTRNKTFGVSGLLYNSNLIPYDRDTDSNWSQMKNLCVNGELIGKEAKTIPVVETTWATWKRLYPQSKVLSTDTGFSRNYGVYPYGDYKTSNNLIFPVSNQDSRLHKKERIHGVIVGEKTRVYPVNDFTNPIEVINETFNDVQIVIAGSAEKNLAVSFERKLTDGTSLAFETVEDELPAIMIDNEGTKWDIFGNGISGPRQGAKLTPTESFIAYWFAWTAFFPNAEIRTDAIALGNIQLMPCDEIVSIDSGDGSIIIRRNKTSRDEQISRSFVKREFIRAEVRKKILKEWSRIITGTRFAPNYVDGIVSGLRIRELPEMSILSGIGIHRDDVIKTVNGIELDDITILSSLFSRLKNENRFDVAIERDKEPIHLIYILK